MSMARAVDLQKSPGATAVPVTGSPQRKCGCGRRSVFGPCTSCGKQQATSIASRDGLSARLRISLPSGGTDKTASGDLHDIVGKLPNSSGQPLGKDVRTEMESKFDRDFGHVRVHADSEAARSANSVNALAYTVGSQIVFGAGQFSSKSRSARGLLAHELAHVVQQGRLSQGNTRVVAADSRFEREADVAAHSILEGRKSSVVQRTSHRLFARQRAQHSLPQPDGSTIVVSRLITPGDCRLRPETRTTALGDIGQSGAFLEVTACRGNVSGGGRGELNYGRALNDASQAVGNLLTNLASGRSPDTAFNTFRDDVSAVSPEAQLKFNLDLPGVRTEISGIAEGSLDGGVSGTGRARVEVDVGPVTVGVEPSVSGGADEDTEARVMVTVGNRRRQADPNCFVCACSKPRITHDCSLLPPPQEPAPRPEPKIIALLFEFEQATPRRQRAYDAGLREAVTLISQGYQLVRIEGNASPEGPQGPQPEQRRSRRSGFRDNLELSQRRAEKARRDLNGALQAELDGLGMRGREHLIRALNSTYPVAGRGELFGAESGSEIAERDLPQHLPSELRSPQVGAPDPLVRSHIISGNSRSSGPSEAEIAVRAFRAGRENARTLFPFMRRALIFLDPPQPVLSPTLSPEILRSIVGTPVACTEEQIMALANANPLPVTGLFRGEECNRPGERP